MSTVLNEATSALARGFLEIYPEEAAETLDDSPKQEVVRIVESLTGKAAARLIDVMAPETAEVVVAQMEEEDFRRILPIVDRETAANLLSRLDDVEREARLALLEPRLSQELSELMNYPEDTAGALMDPRVTTFGSEETVEEGLLRLRRLGHEIDEILLVDPEGKFEGRVTIQQLAVAPPLRRLGQLRRGDPVAVFALATREDVVELLSQTRRPTIPVVNVDGRLLGVIHHDDLVTAAEEEASADLQLAFGVGKEERALSPVSLAVRKRLLWLMVNLGTAFLAAAVVGLFEGTIAKVTALAILLPVVAGQSGNSGAQALAVAMRGLALREVRLSHWPRLALKEAQVGLINGVVISAVTATGVFFWSGRDFDLALVIGVAMVTSMGIAGLAGASIPMMLKLVGQDPAQSSSIILTTVTDVVGFFSFLGLATILLL